MILVIEDYVPPNEARAAELRSCLEANVASGVFDTISRVDATQGGRCTFGFVFRQCAEHYPGRVCVLANADIRFDETAFLLPAVVRPGYLVALTRWENESTPRMLGHLRGERFYSGSQDVWAWVGGELVGVGDRIPLGYIGCDQAILGEAMKAGFKIVNPCLSIRCRHVHADCGRAEGEDVVPGTYVYPEPTTIHVDGNVIWHDWPQEAETCA